MLTLLTAGVIAYLYSGSRIPSDLRQALESAPQVEFLSIDPRPTERRYLPEPDKDGNVQVMKIPADRQCEGHEILGKMNILPEDRRKILSQLRLPLCGAEPTVRNRCLFSPRHALRAHYGGHFFEMLICYQCGDVAFYRDQIKQSYCEMHYRPSPDLANEILRKGGLPLAPREQAAESFRFSASPQASVRDHGVITTPSPKVQN